MALIAMILNLDRKTIKNMKKIYIKPICVEMHIDTMQMLAMSGNAPDSDDSEFGAPAQRRGEWGNLWEHKWE